MLMKEGCMNRLQSCPGHSFSLADSGKEGPSSLEEQNCLARIGIDEAANDRANSTVSGMQKLWPDLFPVTSVTDMCK